MTPRQLGDLLLLAALWGASFLFMRLTSAEFGALALVFVRVAVAALLLLPLALRRGHGTVLRRHAAAIGFIGLVNTALPFGLFMVAAHTLSAGLMAIFNATTPLWGALVAWWWLKERPGGWRLAGLAIGLAGVVALAWGKADARVGAGGVSASLAIAACLAATACYAVAANVARRQLAAVPPLAVAAGSQTAAALATALPALWAWPAVAPSAPAWAAALALALPCTALAYLLYFRLIATAGAQQAVTVTLLIPAFAMAWGWLALAERPTAAMAAGCAVILLGTALSTGLIAPRRPPRPT